MIIGIDASRAVAERHTGTEAYAYYLTRELIELAVERGHHLRLYYGKTRSGSLFSGGTGVEHVAIPFPRLWTHLRLALELWRNPPDVFFTPAHVIPLTYRGTSVATVHDLGFLYFPNAHPRFQAAYLRWSTTHNVRRARHLISDSSATKADLVNFYKVKPEKIQVIYPGLNPSLSPVTDDTKISSVRAKYGIDPFYLLHIGTIQPRKNLVRLMNSYSESGVKHQLVLAGKIGWLARSIREHLQQLEPATRERINLVGYVDPMDKAALISGASALLFPSLYEGFGFPVLEGNACGTPVLSSNTSSIPEIADGAALLIDPLDTSSMAESITRIVEDESLRQRLIEKGLQNARRFSWDKAARQTMEILEKSAP